MRLGHGKLHRWIVATAAAAFTAWGEAHRAKHDTFPQKKHRKRYTGGSYFNKGSKNAMYRVEREIRFCYGHRVSNYAGKCRHLHGHNARAMIALESQTVDESGMVIDFAEIKRQVGAWIDQMLDHRTVLQENDPLVQLLIDAGEPILTIPVEPTAENLARLIHDETLRQGLPVVEVRLYESDASCATYAPTPGQDEGKPLLARCHRTTPAPTGPQANLGSAG